MELGGEIQQYIFLARAAGDAEGRKDSRVDKDADAFAVRNEIRRPCVAHIGGIEI